MRREILNGFHGVNAKANVYAKVNANANANANAKGSLDDTVP